MVRASSKGGGAWSVEEKLLADEIHYFRVALECRVERLGTLHPEVLVMSQSLDRLIVEAQQMKSKRAWSGEGKDQ